MTGTIFNNRWAALGFVGAIALLAALLVGPEDSESQLSSVVEKSRPSDQKKRRSNPWAWTSNDDNIRVSQAGEDGPEIASPPQYSSDELASNGAPGSLRFKVESAPRFASDEELIDDTSGINPVPQRDFVPDEAPESE